MFVLSLKKKLKAGTWEYFSGKARLELESLILSSMTNSQVRWQLDSKTERSLHFSWSRYLDK